MAKTRQHLETLDQEQLNEILGQWGTTAATLSGEAKAKRAKSEAAAAAAAAADTQAHS